MITIIKGTILNTNNYLIESEGTTVLIECSITPAQLKGKLGDKKLDAILLTHGHWDHFLNLEQFLSIYNVPVYLTKEACEKLSRSERSKAEPDFRIPMNLQPFINNFIYINDNESLTIGNLLFKVIRTSGHTNCSVCFLHEENLFTGDTLFNNAIGRTDLETSSSDEMKISLQKLLKLEENIAIYPGHGWKSTIGAEKKNFCF